MSGSDCCAWTNKPLLGNAGVARDLDPRDLARSWGVPVMLHPDDARHRQAAPFGPFENPVGSDLLARFCITAMPFPGHTEGHVLYRLDRYGGVLFAGDSAMGAPEDAGRLAFVRSPVFFNIDDQHLRAGWSTLKLDVRSFAPFHGTPAIDREDLAALTAPLMRQEPTTGFSAV